VDEREMGYKDERIFENSHSNKYQEQENSFNKGNG